MTLDMAFQIALALAATFGTIWIRRLQKDITDLEKAVDRIRDCGARPARRSCVLPEKGRAEARPH